MKKNGRFIGVDDTALGNGSLMRALPCALLNDESSVNLNIMQGEITHNNNICGDIIKEYTKILKSALSCKKIDFKDKNLLNPDGYIINTFNNVLYWSSKNSFEECIIGAVNHGGDADTIAAIAGGISGARFGYSSIPKKWLDKLNLEVKDQLNEFLEFVLKGYEE